MKEDELNIIESLFRDAIVDKFDKEGNSLYSLSTFIELLKEKDRTTFFEAFMDTCKKYRVDYYCLVNPELPERVKTVVTINNYDYFELESSAGNNISVPLANALADALSIALNNEKTLRDIIK